VRFTLSFYPFHRINNPAEFDTSISKFPTWLFSEFQIIFVESPGITQMIPHKDKDPDLGIPKG
jgi:hypothetical protein